MGHAGSKTRSQGQLVHFQRRHFVRTLIQIVFIRSSPNLVSSCIQLISRPSSNMGHAGSKTRSQGQLVHFQRRHFVRTLIQIVFIRSSPNLVSSCIQLISRPSSNMGHAGSKTRSQGQLVHFQRRHFVRTLIQIVFIRSSPNLVSSCIQLISRSSPNMGHAGSKTRSKGQLVHFTLSGL